MKKVLSMILALTLVLALAVPAFASDTTVTDFARGATSTMNATPYSPKISVTVPSTGAVILNPYKLEVKLNPSDATGVKTEVVSPVQHMKAANDNECTLEVGATVTGTPATGVTLLAEAPTDWSTDNKNSAFLQFRAVAAANDTTNTTLPTTGGIFTTISAKTATATDDGTAEGNKTVDLVKGQCVDFGITGNVNPNPATSWSSKMTVKVAIAFTFTPKAAP